MKVRIDITLSLGHKARMFSDPALAAALTLKTLSIVWLGGFRSDMTGTKAQALAEWAWSQGRAFVRFDYFGHGESSGDFAKGTVTRWRDDALAVIDQLTRDELATLDAAIR